jgi:ABC-type multidrug transport system fused ATPase/permease subunit
MEEILKQIDELPVEQLQTLQTLIKNVVEPKIKAANSEVKIENRTYSKLLSYNGKSIIVKHSKHGYNIYSTVVGKSGKPIQGELISLSSSDIWNIRNRFRMGRLS